MKCAHSSVCVSICSSVNLLAFSSVYQSVSRLSLSLSPQGGDPEAPKQRGGSELQHGQTKVPPARVIRLPSGAAL